MSAQPDTWEVISGTWDTDISFDATMSSMGDGSLKFHNTTPAADPQVAWRDGVSVEEGSPYRAEFIVRAASVAAGNTMALLVRWYDASDVLLSTSTVHNAVLSAANTWLKYAAVVTAPANARMARIALSKAKTAFNAWVDFADLFPMPVAFNARRSTDQARTYGEPVIYDTEDFDYGSVYDTTTGMFTAPAAGIYVFNVQYAIGVFDVGQKAMPLLVIGGAVNSWSYGTQIAATVASQVIYSSASWTRLLARGDQVVVSTLHDGGSKTIYGVSGLVGLNVFSGFRVE